MNKQQKHQTNPRKAPCTKCAASTKKGCVSLHIGEKVPVGDDVHSCDATQALRGIQSIPAKKTELAKDARVRPLGLLADEVPQPEGFVVDQFADEGGF